MKTLPIFFPESELTHEFLLLHQEKKKNFKEGAHRIKTGA
jgi:hypothetical protein